MLKKIVLSVAITTMGVSSIALPTMVYAQTKANSEQQATQQLMNILSGLNSLSADFEQRIYSNKKNTKVQQKSLTAQQMNQTFMGNMKVERPGKFYWQTNSPAKQIIVTAGSNVWIYDPDLKQAVRQKLDQQIENTPALLFSGNSTKIMQNYRITQPDATKMFYTLYPKNKDGVFQSLSLSFDAKKTPIHMVLEDNTGQTTHIKFKNTQLNAKIPASLFNFTPPKGTEIIEQ